MTNLELLKLWGDFGDIPINDNDEIEEPFLHFQIGTNRFDIWHWFDEHYKKGVALLIKDYEVFSRLDNTGYWFGSFNGHCIKIEADHMCGPFFIYVKQPIDFYFHKIAQLDTFDDVITWFSKNLREVVDHVST